MRMHTSDTVKNCVVCGKRFGETIEMIVHMATPYTADKCGVCEERFI